MINTKRFFTLAPTDSFETCSVQRVADGFYLQSADGTFAAPLSVLNMTQTMPGGYTLTEAREVWANGTYNVVFYNSFSQVVGVHGSHLTFASLTGWDFERLYGTYTAGSGHSWALWRTAAERDIGDSGNTVALCNSLNNVGIVDLLEQNSSTISGTVVSDGDVSGIDGNLDLVWNPAANSGYEFQIAQDQIMNGIALASLSAKNAVSSVAGALKLINSTIADMAKQISILTGQVNDYSAKARRANGN